MFPQPTAAGYAVARLQQLVLDHLVTSKKKTCSAVCVCVRGNPIGSRPSPLGKTYLFGINPFTLLYHLNQSCKEFKPVRRTGIFFKSCIRETKHLSTDADNTTDTTVGWTKNTLKPKCLIKGKNHPKRRNI